MPTNLLNQAATWLAGVQSTSIPVSVTIGRGGSETDVTAVVGRSPVEQQQGDGTFTVYEARDYLIEVSDYAFSGTAVEPAQGDTIVETINGVDYTFAVMADGGEPPWRYSDQSRVRYRIHTKLRSTSNDDAECLLTENQLRCILGVLPVTC
jgi:hypothetical protein